MGGWDLSKISLRDVIPFRSLLSIKISEGCPGGSVGWASDFSSGHDLLVREFEPRIRLCADSSEPGACFRLCVSISLPLPLLMLCVSLFLKYKIKHKKKFFLKISEKDHPSKFYELCRKYEARIWIIPNSDYLVTGQCAGLAGNAIGRRFWSYSALTVWFILLMWAILPFFLLFFLIFF